ncbi:MAG: hypothetical protein ABI683_03310 [Ginsengibacter sp.]
MLISNSPVGLFEDHGEKKIYNITDTTGIFYFNNYILYRLPPTQVFETGENVKNSEQYFIYNNEDEKGILFDSLKEHCSTKQFSVDSFLFARGGRGKDFDIPVDTVWKLAETFQNTEFVIEKYALIKQSNEFYYDSIYYYYSKNITPIDFSFSRKLDSIKGMKLQKIRLLYNENYSFSQSKIIPKREFSFEFKIMPTNNSNEIFNFFRRFENCSNKNGNQIQ